MVDKEALLAYLNGRLSYLAHNLHSHSSSILPDSLHWTVRGCNLLSRFFGSVDFMILQISDNLAIVLEWESRVMFNVSR